MNLGTGELHRPPLGRADLGPTEVRGGDSEHVRGERVRFGSPERGDPARSGEARGETVRGDAHCHGGAASERARTSSSMWST